MESAQLFYIDGSPFARLCRALILDWELPVKTVLLDFPLDDTIFELNPLGQVPVLKTVGETIFPTMQIAEQLWAMTSEVHSPEFDPLADRQILTIILAIGDVLVSTNHIAWSGLEPKNTNALGFDIVERNQLRVEKSLDWLEEQSGYWLCHETVSVCDYALAAVLLWSESRRPFKWRHRKKLTRIVDSVAEGESFVLTQPKPWSPEI